MINEQKIPCPICKGQIDFDVHSLLKGAKFACPSCKAVVAMTPESMEETKVVMKKYEEIKQKGIKSKR